MTGTATTDGRARSPSRTCPREGSRFSCRQEAPRSVEPGGLRGSIAHGQLELNGTLGARPLHHGIEQPISYPSATNDRRDPHPPHARGVLAIPEIAADHADPRAVLNGDEHDRAARRVASTGELFPLGRRIALLLGERRRERIRGVLQRAQAKLPDRGTFSGPEAADIHVPMLSGTSGIALKRGRRAPITWPCPAASSPVSAPWPHQCSGRPRHERRRPEGTPQALGPRSPRSPSSWSS